MNATPAPSPNPNAPPVSTSQATPAPAYEYDRQPATSGGNPNARIAAPITNTSCVTARTNVCENIQLEDLIVKLDGKQVGQFRVYMNIRANLNSHIASTPPGTNTGLTIGWNIETVEYAPAPPILISPVMYGYSGLGVQQLKPFTIQAAPAGSAGTYNTTLTPNYATTNTQVYGIDFSYAYDGKTLSYKSSQYTLIRCDNAQEVSYGRGCVNVQWTPTLDFQSSKYPAVAHNITLGQATTGYGVPGQEALVRVSKELKDDNRDDACKSESRKNAEIGPKPNTTDQCDEYPFASVQQGGLTARIMWVPGQQNQDQGNDLLGYYQTQRIMTGDWFYVRIT
jgi:hypothetical protein